MDLLWSKERLQKIFSKDSIQLTTAHASGDARIPIRCCRLCGGDVNLHSFCDNYVWEGVEGRYDQLLYDCFGVIQTDGMICERCIRQLRNTQRFRALVQAAFAKPPSEFSTNQSHLGIGEGFARPKNRNVTKSPIVELYKKLTKSTMVNPPRKRKLVERKSIMNSNVQVKRMNIACTVCKQRYPMLVPFEGWKKFVCSRCKKNCEPRRIVCRKCNTLVPTNTMREHLDLHVKSDLKSKNRLSNYPKSSSQTMKKEIFVKPKYQCSQCTKKYTMAQNLVKHVSSVHKNSIHYLCAVCGKDLKTKELLERHMRTHTGQPIYRCDVCMRIFKGKRLFQTHYLTHGK
ncbi:zinc finger protein 569-like isoform X2 [Vanessa cardui]|uniref:zinc finger protein 569-like isoform X2 n=1 Tax=Vanessa cardui TaxID=171605 RepID=UPI001F1459BA|nr:zinc finger protein 569-like isoform X2 [Vanessa cardui]